MKRAAGLSVLCPTRNRPGNVERMTESAQVTADGIVEFVFYTDSDAPGSVPETISSRDHARVLTGERIVLSDMWNACAAQAGGQILMQCDDEVIFRTPGWDAMVAAAFAQYPDHIAFVHGRDLYQPDGTFGTLGFLHRRWVDTVGYFTPPHFSCDYGDTWLNDVSNALGRRVYLPEVITEHLHPVAGKAQWDATHLERLARGARDDVAGLYGRLAPQRQADVVKLRGVMA